MIHRRIVLPIAAAGIALTLLSGCAATGDAADETGENIEDAADATGDAIENAADSVADADVWDRLGESWDDTKSAAAEQWDRLTEDDLADVDDRDGLIDKISDTYDMTREAAADQVDDWADALD